MRIFPVATALARGLRVPVSLVRALEPTDYVDVGVLDTFDMAIPSDFLRSAQTGTTALLDELTRRWRRDGLDASFVVEQGMAAAVIVSVAERQHAGWIAMASHGRGGLGGLVLGSTARAVLHRSPLPVLLAAMPSLDRYHLGAAVGGTEPAERGVGEVVLDAGHR